MIAIDIVEVGGESAAITDQRLEKLRPLPQSPGMQLCTNLLWYRGNADCACAIDDDL